MVNKVAEYYNKCNYHYSWFWSDKESLGMHYGFWNPDTKSKKEALTNSYRELVKLIDPKHHDMVLDAGCGVGGASIWLAKNTKADIIGITIADKQIGWANENAKRYKVLDRIRFLKRSFFDTKFDDNKFDSVFGIESFCYAYPKPKKLFSEMYRVLKKGGKLVMIDGIMERHPENDSERKLMDKFCLGFRMDGGNTSGELVSALKDVGFKNVKFIDKYEEVRPSVEKINTLAFWVFPFLRLVRFFRIISKTEYEAGFAPVTQKEIYEKRLFGYGIIYAEK